MTEKEKRAFQKLYDASVPEIGRELSACTEACYMYNQMAPSRREERRELMRQILGKTGEKFVIVSPFWCDFGYNIEIGENFFSNYNVVILDEAKVAFGDHVFVAPNCGFYTAGHPLDAERRNKSLEFAYPITVGNNVWIGAGTTVLPGVTIGDNAVIGAGSVVNRDIPSGVIAAGNPCSVIRPITEEDASRYLEREY